MGELPGAMMNRRIGLLCALVALASSSQGNSIEMKDAKGVKRVFAWASSGSASKAAEQMLNATWKGLLDGVHAFCGASFSKSGDAIVVNKTVLAGCDTLKNASKQTGAQFHICLGTIPEAAIDDPEPVVRSAVA